MKYKNILVTGGAGFIGSFLVDELVKEDYKVTIFDNLEMQVHGGKKPDYLNKKARFVRGDVRNYLAFKNEVKKADIVFHLAASVGVAQSNYEISKYVDANIGGMANLANILVNEKHHVKKVVIPASMTGLGEGYYKCKKCGVVRPEIRTLAQLKKKDWEMHCPNCNRVLEPIATDELAQEFPSSVYAITKKAQQDLLLLIGKLYDIPVVALRFFNVYGPRQSLSNPYTGVTAIFISRIKNNQEALIYEDGNQSRDFLSVHDVARAFILAMKKNSANYQLINIGSGKPTSIKAVGETIAKKLGKESLIKISYEARKNDVKHCFADIKKAKRILGFTPKVSLSTGFDELIEWSKGQKSEDLFEKAQNELRKKGIV